MKVAQLQRWELAVSQSESAKRTNEKIGVIAGFSAVRCADYGSNVGCPPALKRWATINQSASRTQQIDFCSKAWRARFSSQRFSPG